MKRIKGAEKLEILDAEIIDTWKNPDRVSLTKAELRAMQANKVGWNTLIGCGAALCLCLSLWVVSSMFEQEPAIMPNCQSNCNIDRGLL